MQFLAPVIVSVVTVANTLVPQANLPQVLGVRLAQTTIDSIETDEAHETDEADETDASATLEDARTRRQELREEFAARRSDAREAAEEKREEFRQRLEELRDERRQRILENIDERISAVKDKWLERWSAHLDTLTEILAKLETRAERAQENGADISSVTAAISAAEAAINAAQEEVDGLVDNEYVINITDENNLGEDARTLLSQFKEDLRAIQASVKAARESVHQAFQALRLVVSSNTNNTNDQE